MTMEKKEKKIQTDIAENLTVDLTDHPDKYVQAEIHYESDRRALQSWVEFKASFLVFFSRQKYNPQESSNQTEISFI